MLSCAGIPLQESYFWPMCSEVDPRKFEGEVLLLTTKKRNLRFVFPLLRSLSHSLKSSVFLSENIIIFHSNDYFFTQYLFLNQKKGAIWWLFHDHLRAREREEKVTTNSAPNSPDAILISYVLVILQTLHCLIFIGML